ncbi:MAG: thioredoxin [Polyangiales bacterium]
MSDGTILPCPSCGQKNRVPASRLGATARCGRCKSVVREPGAVLAVDSDAALSTLIASADVPVLVDFWAPWCGPCRTVAPEVAKVAAQHPRELLVLKVNTDVDPAVGARHGIQSIPTMALFRGGREAGRTSGARPAAAITQWVRSLG